MLLIFRVFVGDIVGKCGETEATLLSAAQGIGLQSDPVAVMGGSSLGYRTVKAFR